MAEIAEIPAPNPPAVFDPLLCNAEDCSYTGTTFDGAEKHRESHRDYLYKCPKCFYIFMEKGTYYEHYNLHIPKVNGRHNKKSTKKPPNPLPNKHISNTEDQDKNIMHGDIIPYNLLVTSSGIMKIGDFRVSQLFEDASNELWRSLGTPAFAAPEFYSDIWVLGVTLYRMVMDEYPFPGDTPLADGKSFGEHKQAKIKLLLRSVQGDQDKNIMHGHIEPDNHLVTSSGIMKIGDFRVSQVFEDDSDVLWRSPGIPAFAFAFAAPELYSDIWALGVTLYRMVIDEYPFPGDTSPDTSDMGLCQGISILYSSVMTLLLSPMD